MVSPKAIGNLALWKVYKRLLCLGQWPDGELGAINPYCSPKDPGHGADKAASRQRIQNKLVHVVLIYFHRYQLSNKTNSRWEYWELAKQEIREEMDGIWESDAISRRLWDYEHRSHVAYAHAVEDLLMHAYKWDQASDSAKKKKGIPKVSMNDITLFIPLRDITMAVFVVTEADLAGRNLTVVSLPLLRFLFFLTSGQFFISGGRRANNHL